MTATTDIYTYCHTLSLPAALPSSVRAQAALPRLFALTLSLGGTLSGEHGIGVAKRNFMARAFDAPTLAAMRAVKAAFDPDGIRSEEHTSELQSLMRTSYAVFCLTKKKIKNSSSTHRE